LAFPVGDFFMLHGVPTLLLFSLQMMTTLTAFVNFTRRFHGHFNCVTHRLRVRVWFINWCFACNPWQTRRSGCWLYRSDVGGKGSLGSCSISEWEYLMRWWPCQWV